LPAVAANPPCPLFKGGIFKNHPEIKNPLLQVAEEWGFYDAVEWSQCSPGGALSGLPGGSSESNGPEFVEKIRFYCLNFQSFPVISKKRFRWGTQDMQLQPCVSGCRPIGCLIAESPS